MSRGISRRVRLSVLVLASVALVSAASTLPVLIWASPASQASGQVIDVPAGGSLQAALNQVQPGGTVRLAAGATYVGSFTLPAKGGTDVHPDHYWRHHAAPSRHAHRSELQATPRHHPVGQHVVCARDRGWRKLLPHRRRGIRGQRERVRRHHRPRAFVADHIGVGAASHRARSRPHRRRSDRRAEARHRGKCGSRHHHELRHPQHQGCRAGFPGDRRVELSGAIRHQEQLPAGCRREHHVRWCAHQHRWPRSERHHGRRQRSHEGPGVEGDVVDRQESLRAQERAQGDRPPERDAVQLGRRAARLRHRADAAELERTDSLGGHRRRGVQREHRGALRWRVQPPRARQHGAVRPTGTRHHQGQSGLRHRRFVGGLRNVRADRWRAERCRSSITTP